MNERIEQLAEQCWTHTKEPLFGAKSPHWEFDRQKFAELIVQDIISQVAMVGISNFENEDIAWTVETVIEIVKNRYKNDTENCI